MFWAIVQVEKRLLFGFCDFTIPQMLQKAFNHADRALIIEQFYCIEDDDCGQLVVRSLYPGPTGSR